MPSCCFKCSRQFIAPDKAGQATTYYSIDGAAGKAIPIKVASGPLRVGVIELGVGTLVTYGRKQDYYRLYDIDHESLLRPAARCEDGRRLLCQGGPANRFRRRP